MNRRLFLAALSCLMLAIPTLGQPLEPFVKGRFVEGVKCRKDPTQTYTLYLPTSYRTDRPWPALLIFDPRGRSVIAAELFREAAETYGWILLSSNDTRSDGPWEPNQKALQALWPEVHLRYPVDEHRVYAAGFSGGVIVAWYLGQHTKGLAGVIGSGGRLVPEIPIDKIYFAQYGTAGNLDFNYSEMFEMDALMAEKGAPHRLEIYDGRHSWMPQELAYEGVEWMEVLAMKQGLRPKDEGILETIYQKDLAKAHAMEATAGQEYEALRRFESILRTYDGLRDVTDLRKHVAELKKSRVVRKLKDEKRDADAFEENMVRRLSPTLQEMGVGETIAPAQKYINELQIVNLQNRAKDDSYGGVAAKRTLEWIFTRTSFYIQGDLVARKRYAQAAVSLGVAAEIHPSLPYVWYNLACAQARGGEVKAAIESLGRALDTGYKDLGHMQEDEDLESIRNSEGYAQLVARLSAEQK